MGKNYLYRILSRIVDIRPGEEKLVLLLFTCFFLITSPHTIIKALRYADLLRKMGVGGLPIAYLAAAVVTDFVQGQTRSGHGRRGWDIVPGRNR